jgi:CubicO group peptidase (beta-lactamase class C family)
MREDDLFAIASMTKPITATALMILVDEGKLSIDDPVKKHLPEFATVKFQGEPPATVMTVRHCLTHTAGLAGSQRTIATLKESVEEIAARDLAFQPGERWQYSPGLTVCGRIIEVVSKQPYEAFLESRIFKPLGMNETSFAPSEQQRKRLVRLYQPSANKQDLAVASHWLVDDAGKMAANPSGGLFSTAADLSRFYQMILNGGELDGERTVSQAAVDEMTKVRTGSLTTGFTPGNGWGLGWCVIREPQGVTESLSPGTFGHGGAFGTQGWVDPKRKTIFVLLIQRTKFGNADGASIRGAFHKTAVEALGD